MPELTIIASSDSASRVSPDGSRFSFQLSPPLVIKSNNITVTCESSTIWWVIPNIITGQNDTINVRGPDTTGALQDYIVVLPQGLYDLSQLGTAIQRSLENQGAKVNPEPLLSLLADDATQKVIIRLNYDTVRVVLGPQSPYGILGFTTGAILTRPPTNNTAPNPAKFNIVDSFLIHCDAVNSGIRINNRYSQVVSQVAISVPPGSQIIDTPFRPPVLDAPNLHGRTDSMTFWLTDQLGREVNTNGETFSARIRIAWD